MGFIVTNLSHPNIGIQRHLAEGADQRKFHRFVADLFGFKLPWGIGAYIAIADHVLDTDREVITTVQKFPFILDDIGNDHRDRRFAIIIDEAHSSQGGKAAGAVNRALGEGSVDDEEDQDTFEDQVNRIIESRRMLTNASYLAFTATPKNKTLEMFGIPDPQPDGKVRHLPFHNYTMKQAIEEGFIMDVLTNYTPVSRYFNVIKSIEDDPKFDSKRARSKLRRYVENHEYAITQKAGIIIDHFNDSVFTPKKMGGEARAMVVVDGVDRAIRYYHAIRGIITERELPFRALVAFSGARKVEGLHDQEVSEAQLNGFPESGTAERFQQDPYRILICADQVPDGVRRAAPPHYVRGQAPLGYQGSPDPFPAQPLPPEEIRHLRAGLPEHHRGYPRIFRRLLPDHHPLRRDRPGQAPTT